MNKPIVNSLEKYLSGELRGEALEQFEAMLESQAGAREQVQAFRGQAELLRTLRAPREMEPAPGFYGRVMERIEQQAANSLWAVFFEPFFARKLMYASLVLLVAFSSAAITTLQRPAMHEAVPLEFVADSLLPPASGENQEHDRQVVFANLATFTGGAPQALMLTSFELE
jgi:anti-sigma factor RsiW